MRDLAVKKTGSDRAPRTPIAFGVYLRRTLVIAYLGLLVAWPVSLVVWHTFADGNNLATALADPTVIFALQMSLVVAFWAVLINTVFGVGISLLLVHHEFRGCQPGSGRRDDLLAHHFAFDQMGADLRRGVEPRSLARRVRCRQDRVRQRHRADPNRHARGGRQVLGI